MNFPGLIFLLLAHFISGYGVLRLFRLSLPPVATACLSMICGVALLAFVPCFVQLMHIPITMRNISMGIVIFTLICSVPIFINFQRPVFKKPVLPALYEWPFILLFIALAVTSIWRCFYYPCTPRDMLTGTELLAEYAVREKNMVSSVFTVDMQMIQPGANNIFKSPFITGLQIIYKLLVQPFGQVWLSVLSVSFIVWIYALLRDRVHPFVAGVLMLLFITMPDVYAYTYVMLYDYSNMIFFFGSIYFLALYTESERLNDFMFAAFLIGIATYIRTETMFLAAMIVPFMVWYFYKKKTPLKKALLAAGIFAAMPVFFDVLCINVFVKHFVPIPFELGGLINPNLSDLSFLVKRLTEITTLVIFSKFGEGVYGYFIYFFTGVLCVDLVWQRRFNKEAKMALFGIAIVYVGLAFLGYLFPSNTLDNTTKRGLFKALPLMLLYMANSAFLERISAFLRNMENPVAKSAAQPKKVVVQVAAKPKVKKK